MLNAPLVIDTEIRIFLEITAEMGLWRSRSIVVAAALAAMDLKLELLSASP